MLFPLYGISAHTSTDTRSIRFLGGDFVKSRCKFLMARKNLFAYLERAVRRFGPLIEPAGETHASSYEI